MFGVGFNEILMIAIVAIIFLGPDKLPGVMVDIAKFIKKIKATVTDAKESLNSELNLEELKKEMGLDDIKNEALAYKQELLEAREKLAQVNPIDQFKEQREKTKAEMAELANSFNEDTNQPAQTDHEPDIQMQSIQSNEANETNMGIDQPKQPDNINSTHEHEQQSPQEAYRETTNQPQQPKPQAKPSPYQTAYDSKTYKALKERNNEDA